MYTPRVNPNVNYGFGMIMMCQIGCNKCTTLAWNVDNGRDSTCGVCKVKRHGKSLYLSLNFAMNLKVLQKGIFFLSLH